jgi:transmembrane protein 18
MGDAAAHMAQMYEDVRSAVRSMQHGSSHFWDVTMDFIHAIDWSERWIQAILTIEVALLLTAISWRHTPAVQLVLFAICAVVVVLAEPLNRLGAEYWEDFARQPYFDKRGGFITGVVLTPLLVIMLVCVVMYLSSVIAEMVTLKRSQLRHQLAHQRRLQARAGGKKSV